MTVTAEQEQLLKQVGILCLGMATQMHMNAASMPPERVLLKIRRALERADVELPPCLQSDVDNVDVNKLDKLLPKLLRELK